MLSLKQLKYLVAVADQLHFRRAAETVNVSQPTLSAQLKDLEKNLGVQLVERSRSRVLLTPLGKEVATKAKSVLKEVDEIKELTKQVQNTLDGTFRLGTLPSLGPYLLPHFLSNLHGTYRNLRLYIREGTPDLLIEQLEDGRLDLLLFPLPIKKADIEAIRVFREPLMVVMPPDHPFAAKKALERDDLTGETVLALERGYLLHDQVHELCEEFQAKLSLDFDGTSLDALRHMVSMGIGITFLPLLYVLSEIRDESVVVRPIRRNPPTRTVGLAWRRNSPGFQAYRELAAFIRISMATVSGITTLR